MVFKMAYSPARSLAVMAMVLARTIIMMMMTTREMTLTETRIASVMAMKPSWKAFSVSVRVSAREFLKVRSTTWAISGDLKGSANRMTYQPT